MQPAHFSAASSDLPPHLEALNNEQFEAATTLEGPLLVLAGAGTGKTRVLTTRIAHLLHTQSAWPGQILAVTFTNKAAREMGERVRKLLQTPLPLGEVEKAPAFSGEGWQDAAYAQPSPETPGGASTSPSGRGDIVLPWLGTFHSIGAKMLRRHAERLGFKSNFTILDTDDQLRLIKALLIERNADPKSNPPKAWLSVIQSWKDRGLTPDKVPSAESAAHFQGRILNLYRDYQARLKTLNAMDFGDLLLHCLTLFTEHPDVLAEYGTRFRYILVDEYQDTNVAQYLWLRLLALAHGNICCVGDDDQSIYGWRGAEVGNILRFERDFEGAKTIRLERNYRSTSHILAAASSVIAHNKERLGKTLWTDSDHGEKLTVKQLHDSDEEAYFVGETLEALQRKQVSLDDTAILVRASFQTRPFEERFLTLGLPYRVVGGLRFYERQEVRDAIAYMRVTFQPDDDLAFERIINLPKRGIGKATLASIHSAARGEHVSMHEATARLLERGELKGKVGEAMRTLLEQFATWRAATEEQSIGEVTARMLEESGYLAMWQQDKTPEAPGRIENLRELVRAMGEFESLESFLEHVGLVTERVADSDGVPEPETTIMTLHAAKGLEFDHVFLPGWEEGVFPNQRAMDETGLKGLEEERRLAYVGITRARKQVYITHAERRRMFTAHGMEWTYTVPSRFITELPEDHVENAGMGDYQRLAEHRRGWRQDIAAVMQTRLSHRERPNAALPRSGASDPFRTGARVVHSAFGQGTVLGKSGDHLLVQFDSVGPKKMMPDYLQAA